jgi:hypothetical protein
VNREQALKLANEIVAAWIDNPPKNDRGYIKDGYTPPTLTQRVYAVEKLAEFLWEPEPEPVVVTPPTVTLRSPDPFVTVFGWRVDGSGGKPTLTQYTAAKDVLSDLVNAPRTGGEIRALLALVAAYEAGEDDFVTMFGWRVDGTRGAPTYDQYKRAVARFKEHNTSGKSHSAAEGRALRALTSAYEATAGQPEPHQHKASCDDSSGNHLCGFE